MKPLDRITQRVCKNGHPYTAGTPIPLLGIAEFFEGNDVIGSIGCNLETTPHPNEFYALFKAIVNRENVADVRVQITAFDSPDWPFSDTVYIMTPESVDEVASWFPAHLAPDETWEGFTDQAFEAYDLPVGCRAIAVWWD